MLFFRINTQHIPTVIWATDSSLWQQQHKRYESRALDANIASRQITRYTLLHCVAILYQRFQCCRLYLNVYTPRHIELPLLLLYNTLSRSTSYIVKKESSLDYHLHETCNSSFVSKNPLTSCKVCKIQYKYYLASFNPVSPI